MSDIPRIGRPGTPGERTMQLLRESPDVLDHIARRVWAEAGGIIPDSIDAAAKWVAASEHDRQTWRDRVFARMAEDCAAYDANHRDDPTPPPDGGLPLRKLA